MDMLHMCLITGLIVVILIILFAAFKTKRPLKTLFFSAISGVISLLIISLTGNLTGVHLAVNAWTLSVAALCSIPGVILLVLVKVIWQV